ncbi:PIN domain-containing protein [bacterium]|nr:PIN domain-containing protein [bacterium]
MGKQQIKMYPFLKDVKHIFIDTMFFIYHFEKEARFLQLTTQVLNLVETGKIQSSTSCLTIMEILVKPMSKGRKDLVEEYKMLLETFPNLNLIPLDTSVAYEAAYFRSFYNLKPADSIQIASAAISGCDHFLTNDKELIRVKELNICYMDNIVK